MNMKKAVALFAAIMMIATMLPVSAYAAGVDFSLADSGCDYYNLISKTDYALAPGAVETEIVINNDEGTARNVVHAIEVDLTNPNISVMPVSKNISETTDYSDPANWGILGVTQHAAYVEEELGLNVVGGMNVSLSWDFTHPYGLLIYNGVVLCDNRQTCDVCGKGHPGGGYLAITKDGKAELRDPLDPLTGDEWMAQTVCFSYIVKDGVSQHKSPNHADDANAAPRSVIGIKEDGTLVLMMVDGRQAPYSKGMQNHEMAETMLALGCVDAINCDGGGSSTFITEREGTGELTMKSRPSDGTERSTISGILVVSKAVADGKFDHATVKSSQTYVTPGSTVMFDAIGADSAGGPADIPADVTWQLADSSMGTVESGVFVSNGKTGVATVQMVYNGEVVGEDSVNVVIPDTIGFAQANITAPYSKSVSLDIVAKYGFNEVTLKDGDILYTLSDNAMGTISGKTFTATSDESITAGTVTATLACNTALTAKANIAFGKASEIVYDFESGADSIANITYEYKGVYTPDKYNFSDTLSVVSVEEGGKVKNGNYALKVACDGDSITCMNWCQTRLNGWNIDLKDAISLSFWMYIPEGSHGYEWDFGNAIPVNLGQEFITGTGWQYFTVNVADIGTNVTNLNQIRIYHSDTFDDYPNYYADATFYIDDLTVNYSTAVEDFDPPVISNVLLSHDNVDTGVAMNGQTIDTNVVAVTAKAADNMTKSNYTGLNPSSVNVYVDGVAVNASCSDTGFITMPDMALANGMHIFRIEASDNRGNTSYVEKTIVIDAADNTKNTIHYAPVDASKVDLPADSLFWMDLSATNIANVQKVEMIIDLDNNSKWELDHMEIADGFAATYTVDSETNDATIVFERTGAAQAAVMTLADETILAKLPIRAWTPNFVNVNEDAMSYRWMAVQSYVQMGSLTELDGSTTTFASPTYTNVTEFNQTRLDSTTDMSGYHTHTAVAVEDLAPTCTEDGYTGRTYCEGCDSVADWGTTVPATGHTYGVVDGQLVCDCGEVLVQSGLIELDDAIYYAVNGKLTGGWIYTDAGYYYFDKVSYKAAIGEVVIDGHSYTFDESGLQIKGSWETKDNNLVYYWGGAKVVKQFFEIDGNTYYFDGYGNMVRGYQKLMLAIGNEYTYHYFNMDTGVLETTFKNGVYEFDGKLMYFNADGHALYEGLIEIDGDYYYVNSSCEVVTNKTYYVTKNNGLMDSAYYDFGPDGKMVVRELRNGIVYEDGVGYYYVNDVKQLNLGMIEVDGDYYYVRSGGQLATGTYYVYSGNGIVPDYSYQNFDVNGKLIVESEEPDTPVEPTGKNGIYNEGGTLYYYVNDVKQYNLGLIEYEGDYYYVRSGGQLAVGSYLVWNGNGYVDDMTTQEFGADGKMIINEPEQPDTPVVPTVKNGIYNEGGTLYYYINDVKQYNLGLIEYEGDYYYVRSGGQLAVGSYLVWNGNGYVEDMTTQMFGEDGKMIVEDQPDIPDTPVVPTVKNGIYSEGGNLYYYINDVKQYNLGLIEYEGDYYYVRSGGQLAIGSYLVWNGNGYVEDMTTQMFGEDGKMVIESEDPETPDTPVVPDTPVEPTVKNGIYSEGGNLYYYINDVKQYNLGLIEFEGSFYYVRSGGQLAVGSYLVWTGNGYVEDMTTHEFGSDGKMIDFPADVVYKVETVNSAALKAGDEVKVSVYVTAEALSLIEYKLGYDSTKLEVASVELSDTFKTFDMNGCNDAPSAPVLNDETVGEVWFNAMALDAIEIGANARIATITFKAITDVNESVDMYAVCDPIACDGDYNVMVTRTINGGIAI